MKLQAKTLSEKQAAKLAALQLENKLENDFTELTGFTPRIVSADSGKPFAVFSPELKADYLAILEALQPSGENFILTFAGSPNKPTFSPYSIHYGGKHSNPAYMDATVKFNHSICPVWIDMPPIVKQDKFNISSIQGDHKGFGNYETFYTYKAIGGTSVQNYYGENKTMYAKNEGEVAELKAFIFS